MRTTLLLLLSSFLISCTGEKGETGPPGKDGNANVKSYSFTMDPSDWKDRGAPGGYDYTLIAEMPFPELDEGIIDSGLVMAYWTLEVGSDTYNFPLPYSINYQGGTEEYGFELRPGTITFTIKDNTLNATPPLDPYSYRVVLASSLKFLPLEKSGNLPYSTLERQFGPFEP